MANQGVRHSPQADSKEMYAWRVPGTLAICGQVGPNLSNSEAFMKRTISTIVLPIIWLLFALYCASLPVRAQEDAASAVSNAIVQVAEGAQHA